MVELLLKRIARCLAASRYSILLSVAKRPIFCYTEGMATAPESSQIEPAARTGDILKSWRSRIVGYGKVAADQVTPHPLNPKIHPYEQQLTTAEILEALGQIGPIIINRTNGYLVDGEQCTWLALELHERTGISVELDVAYVELSEEEHEQALLTFDPVGDLAKPDPDRLKELLSRNQSSGPHGDKLRERLKLQASLNRNELTSDPGSQIDRAEELQQKWQVQPGDLWEIGPHRLLCGDSMKAENITRLLHTDTAPTLFFDPPWDLKPDVPLGQWEHILAFTDGGFISGVIDKLGPPTWIFVWDCVSTWYVDETRPLQRYKSCLWYGSFKTFNLRNAFYGQHDDLSPRIIDNGRGPYTYVPDIRGKVLSDVYVHPITQMTGDNGVYKHEKPLDWVRLLIGDCTQGAIFDPYAGWGTSLAAAQQLGRPCFGIEIEPSRCAVILQRLLDLGCQPERVPMVERMENDHTD